MAQTAFTKDINLLSSPLLILVLIFPLIFIIRKYIIISHSSKRQPLPPGPKPWPILGNILHLGKKPHESLTCLAKIHGPLMSLRLGKQLLVVGSSPKAAAAILRTHERFLCARYIPKCTPYESHVLDRIAILFATNCTDEWKCLRALCKTQLFSAKAIESQTNLRENKVREMVEFLRTREGKVVSIGEVVFAMLVNVQANLFFSKDLICLEDNEVASRLIKSLFRSMLEMGVAPNIADFYPIFEGLDPQGLKRKMSKCVKELFATWGVHIKERRESHVPDQPNRDLLDVFLANGFDDNQINWLIFELFIAGTDTTSTTIEWTMAELLKNEEATKKVREELKKEISEGSLNESHVSQLPYLNACVKESLRLHPPGPFLLPHRALETCEVMNYTIPKDSRVVVNVWAIGRDPSIWEDPLSFKPDRFIVSNVDFKGQHYELLPFGSGRRSCPGLAMATKQLTLTLASLVHFFDWSLPNGKDVVELDMNDNFGVTLQKKQPLLLIPNRKM